MATPSSGVLLTLLNATNSGSKTTGEHRSSLLQVTDIVPIDLDQKTLIPRRGFYIKLSDSSHYIYASLPFDELDLVLTNKLQLGQYIYIEKLEPGSPVPVAKGIKPINGRHPLIGTPKPLTGFRRNNEKLSSDRRRGSWVMNIDDPVVLKPVPLNFDQFTPVKDNPRDAKSNASISPIVRGRLSIGGYLMPKIEKQPERQKRRGSSVFLRRNSITPASMSKTVLQSRISKTSLAFNSSSVAEVTSCTNQLNQIDAKNSVSSDLVVASESLCGNNAIFISNCDTGSGSSLSLSGKLGILGKEVVQQRESAQEIAIQALRNVAASENIVRCLEMFADLSKRSKPEAPASYLEEFLEFHSRITQAVTGMVSIQATTGSSLHETKQEESKDSALHEIKRNSMDHFCIKEEIINPSRRRPVLCKSIASGRVWRSSSKVSNKVVKAPKDDENKKPRTSRRRGTSASRSCLSNMIRLGKEIEVEARKWFMEFLEKTLETGFKKSKEKLDHWDRKKVPQSLMMRVINWIEVQQCDPKATQITRKLRIKMKNPRDDIQSEQKYTS